MVKYQHKWLYDLIIFFLSLLLNVIPVIVPALFTELNMLGK